MKEVKNERFWLFIYFIYLVLLIWIIYVTVSYSAILTGFLSAWFGLSFLLFIGLCWSHKADGWYLDDTKDIVSVNVVVSDLNKKGK